ncbi:hypothetical protein ACFXJ8_26125 [Nonomuraea sp. NPDC059194]|uniref:hypothetical protein n=1 Tax=Nonomuraea sp. NPDC059194 TaxID=3346764 RepID=UPI0036A5F1BE
MADIPAEAVQGSIPDKIVHKAATAMLQAHISGEPNIGFMRLSRAALEAAVPLLAAQVRRETAEQIAAEIERVVVSGDFPRPQEERGGFLNDARWSAHIARQIGEARDSR